MIKKIKNLGHSRKFIIAKNFIKDRSQKLILGKNFQRDHSRKFIPKISWSFRLAKVSYLKVYRTILLKYTEILSREYIEILLLHWNKSVSFFCIFSLKCSFWA